MRQSRLKDLARQERRRLTRELNWHESIPTAREHGPTIVGAFFAPWQETGIHSFRAHAANMTHLFPVWARIDRSGRLNLGDFDPALNPHSFDVLGIARSHGIRVEPVLTNVEGDVFDGNRVAALLRQPDLRDRLVKDLRDWADEWGFAGINIDFEALTEASLRGLPGFVAELKAGLGPGREVSVDVESSTPGPRLRELASASDFVQLMAYDEHSEDGGPGPIASFDWSESVLARALESVPANKLVLGVGGYAYDWRDGKPQAEAITYQEAIRNAAEYRDEEPATDVIEFDPKALNSTFEYWDDADNHHRVWILDGVSAANQLNDARPLGLRGCSLWALGSEDPSYWSVVGRGLWQGPMKPSGLKQIDFQYDVEFDGEGEVLSVRSLPQRGSRDLEVEPGTGLIVDTTYRSYPSSYVIARQGRVPKKIVLTFDDGPSTEYTPEILDELKRLRVPAAFFVIGNSVEEHPDLVRRMVEEGHEVGNHSFTHANLGAVSPTRVRLELNATQRAIESVTGRSTALFRPPYNADAEPTSAEEVRPILLAAKLGYRTIGEFIDPQDWNLATRTASGSSHLRTPEEIAQAAEAELRRGSGSMLLFHDGGGDRSRTIQAIRLLVPRLRAEGYEFTSIHGLLGIGMNQVMPSIPWSDLMLVRLDGIAFAVAFGCAWLLAAVFVGAIVLGLARVVVMTALAIWGARGKSLPPTVPSTAVSVLIAAYNEEAVIERTIASVLKSDYPIDEVIVVDDGSTDGTAGLVEDYARSDARVRLISKDNEGKASALNRALQEANGEVFVGVDADTQLDPRAIGLLVRRMADPRVGAVAGNVRVGNVSNLLTVWQSVEYTTSQNLDRRAQAALNCITVVPGAIGAWRTQAVRDLGGFVPDTLAEDMDLTWRLRTNGWRLDTENAAYAYTEAPDQIGPFFRQRFRWAYGTLQCLWKHRRAVGRHGAFGWLSLPSLWLFQIVFMALAPIVDLQLAVSALDVAQDWVLRGLHAGDWKPLAESSQRLELVLSLFALFVAVEWIAGLVAYRLDRQKPLLLVWLPLQRFVYRQIMYGVILKSIVQAIRGVPTGWNKLKRKGTVVAA